ncbi:Acidic leucine-rich nuclear phosphoprotein 32-related protein 2 [Dichanthelium oligosanthes]|uniref:Acidic leucine-rich nuclear phosphoprotein 32-related protein 2 n=1 Tax=Dichanthelium oligosanthes TaxID=888268 RepID=A0A1E5WAF3_9POAL|nr:Acidic leucine-rich nuclear phosphoprotein 32-related protein 2 [Dichanthelium oligosanthes]
MAAAGEDDAAWERAIAAATKATSAAASGLKTLTLDGTVKSTTGRLPSPALLERFAASLEELSVAGARLSSLAGLPRLPALRRLSLPDNRLAGAAALTAVAEACGATLRHLDLGNNRFAEVEELEPLAKLGVEALDLYQCPVTKVKGYREKVFALVPSLKYLDSVDAEGNERLETDDEEDVEEEDDEEEEGEDGEGEDGEDGEEGEEDDGEEGDEEDGEDEEEGDEEGEDEGDEAEDDEEDADVEDKENIESKAGSSLPSKRKRDNDDKTNGDN